MPPGEMVFVRSGVYPLGEQGTVIARSVNKLGMMSIRSRESEEVSVRGFWIDRFEVSVAQYRLCVRQGVCSPEPFGAFHKSAFRDPLFPMVGMTAGEAKTYCSFRGKRLPTSDEWEVAARGKDKRIYPWGNQPTYQRANLGTVLGPEIFMTSLRDGHGYAAVVHGMRWSTSASKAMNMAGNVSEWTVDDKVHHLRGGSWRLPPVTAVTFTFRPVHSNVRAADVGIRCARTSS